MNQHGTGGRTILGQLSVASRGGHQGQLDGVQGVGVQDFHIEACIHHRGLQFHKVRHKKTQYKEIYLSEIYIEVA